MQNLSTIGENAKAPVYFIDAFTAEKFQGNPTAVCILQSSISYEKMLLVAKELNLPVTAFIEIAGSKDELYRIYYFTTVTEIPACGHATLAAAKAIGMLMNINAVSFKTCEERIIEVAMRDDKIIMSYPVYKAEPFPVSNELIRSLSIEIFKPIGFSKELETLFIELPDAQQLRNIQPDYARLIKSSDKIIEVVITSVSDDPRYDYLLRSFCPWIGIDEDPVTGSVHSVLAGFWSDRLHKNNLRVYQASKRGGEAFVTAYADKVELGGQAVPVIEGLIYF
jgi:PhzF family phenazine biosynthesis protein